MQTIKIPQEIKEYIESFPKETTGSFTVHRHEDNWKVEVTLHKRFVVKEEKETHTK